MATLRIEDVKAAGVAVDVNALAASGFESISEEDRYRLKTQGVCAQRQVGVFMLRIRVPGGKLSAGAMRCVAGLAERFGSPILHVTTRSGLEIHHVAIERVSAVWAGLAEVGLTTKGACGDTIRNVVACAHAGVYVGEVLPLEPFARLLHERIVARSDETNISRKMNPALACSPHCDDHVATSDFGFVATPGKDGAAATFTVWGAGGLGATPRLAIRLRDELPQEDVVPAFDALVAISTKYADRSSRAKAKIKMLVERWGAERFREVFEEEFQAAKARGGYAEVVCDETQPRLETVPPRAGHAVPQKQPGLFTLPALIPMGEIHSEAARELADAAERYGDGTIYLTPDQNAELHGVREAEVPAALAALRRIGLRTEGRGGIADVVSCVGLEYCPLAVTHSMTMGEELALAFETRSADSRYADFRIHVSGCPHSCAKHQVADIGLAGALTDVGGRKVEAFVMYLGGNARERRLGVPYPKKIPRSEVLRTVNCVLERFESERLPSERFSQTVARVGVETYHATVAEALAVRDVA